MARIIWNGVCSFLRLLRSECVPWSRIVQTGQVKNKLLEDRPERSSELEVPLPPSAAGHPPKERDRMEPKSTEELLRQENRGLMAAMQNLRGNILVHGRIRPFLASERNQASLLSLDGLDRLIVRQPFRNQFNVYTLDRIFDSCAQSTIFVEGESYAYSAVEGFNSCILAYGPTGSGKTHTMFGPPTDPGLVYSVASKVFELCKEPLEGGGEGVSRVSVSVMEVYNETIRDLLDPFTATVQAKLINDSLMLQGLLELELHSMDEFRSLVRRATRSRATAATGVHDQSSRSHCLIQLVIRTITESGTERHGKIVFVDLAGSENLKQSSAEGSQLEETKNINRSLSALGDVMKALESRDRHIPYRNSQLTTVLSDSLTRGSKVMMIATISPNQSNVEETISTLNFSCRVRKINLGRAMADVQWKQLQMENAALKQKMKALEESAKKTPASPMRHATDQNYPFASPGKRESYQKHQFIRNSEELAKQNLVLRGQVDRLELKTASLQAQLAAAVTQNKEEARNRQRRDNCEMESLKRRVRELEGLLMRTSSSLESSSPSKNPLKMSSSSKKIGATSRTTTVIFRPDAVSQDSHQFRGAPTGGALTKPVSRGGAPAATSRTVSGRPMGSSITDGQAGKDPRAGSVHFNTVDAKHTRQEKERQEEERIVQERLEQVRMDQVRIEQELIEQERIEQERIEQERIEQERIEQDRIEQERIEQERIEQERIEQERIEQERIEQERIEQERIEQERIEQERIEQERIEQKRIEQERIEQERIENERLEQERIHEASAQQPAVSERPDQLQSSPAQSPLRSSQSGNLQSAIQQLPPRAVVSTKRIQRAISIESIKREFLRRSTSGFPDSARVGDRSTVSVSGSVPNLNRVAPGHSNLSQPSLLDSSPVSVPPPPASSSDFRHPKSTAIRLPMHPVSVGTASAHQVRVPHTVAAVPSEARPPAPAMRPVAVSANAQPKDSVPPPRDAAPYQFGEQRLPPVSRSLKDHKLVQNRRTNALRSTAAVSVAVPGSHATQIPTSH